MITEKNKVVIQLQVAENMVVVNIKAMLKRDQNAQKFSVMYLKVKSYMNRINQIVRRRRKREEIVLMKVLSLVPYPGK